MAIRGWGFNKHLSQYLQSCGHLLGKGWPLGPLVCDVFLSFVTFPYGVLGQVWYLIVWIPDFCPLPYFENIVTLSFTRDWDQTRLQLSLIRVFIARMKKAWINSNRNCLGQFREIPWNQSTDVHRGSTLITRVITWRWRNITWHWRHRNYVNTITSVIAAKQTA